ncbi:MAG TPA: FAD-dependent oxidoreductase [Planctomycetota bacterium]|nr:FAD-dependent oxidoreductase [Planctomycetota bacterium]
MPTDPATASWRVFQLDLALDDDPALLRERAAHVLGLDSADLRSFRIARKALDARKRGGARRLRFVCHADLTVDARLRPAALRRALKSGRAAPTPPQATLERPARHPSLHRARVLVVGGGPAGLFAALALARNDVAVTLLERGPEIRARGRALVRFHRTRQLDPEANLLFGEGGAGTYSDGKIYTRVDDPLEVTLLEELVRCGAPEAIVYDSLAHIGTDRLHRILPAFRERLRALGVELAFDTRVDALVLSGGAGGERRVTAVRTGSGEIGCDALVLATGHSARDTWAALAEQGVPFEAKPFQIGVRIEHPQELIDRGRYGDAAERLGAAAYNLVCRAGDGLPAAYSFCMCPGGRIVASVNQPGLLCTNGMSNSRHSSAWASAAVVTTLGPEHFGSAPFDGVALQRELEVRFFEAGGGDYTAPAQGAQDFVLGRGSASVRRSTWPFGSVPARVDRLLPPLVRGAIARALLAFERQVPGFAGNDGQLVGLESRSSGPVRIPRDPRTRRALGFENLLPVGEGAGHAGGIMSAALDGANAALALVECGTGP